MIIVKAAGGEALIRATSRFDASTFVISRYLSKGARSRPSTFAPNRSRLRPPSDLRIQARPPGEKEVETKFPFPDVVKEKELGALQSQIADLYRSSQYRQAVSLSKALLETTRSHFGTDHPATASAHNNLGLMHKHLGDFDESRQQYKHAMAIYKRVVGGDHASYASVLHNLGTCARTQLHLDSSLRATDRLSLLQESAQALEQAYSIREQELGPEHPHSVASLSSWGATLAAQVLSRYKKSQDKWVSTIPTHVSQQGWQAAEHHLRKALRTAVDNPRGPSIHNSSSRRSKPIRIPSMVTTATTISEVASLVSTIETLSGASAAQNLAVFLKARAVTESPPSGERLREAKEIYEQVLQVRSRLLPPNHADLYATQYSLAEVLEVLGEVDRANEIRQEILDAYDPDEDVQRRTSLSAGSAGEVPVDSRAKDSP